MSSALYLAWKYLSFNKSRSATLIACITLIAVLPLSLNVLLDESERQLLSRAQVTPLLVGAKGSSLDLVMNSLYFDDEVPELISMQAVTFIRESRLAAPVPLYTRFRARGAPIVGTTLDYFTLRGLKILAGRPLVWLGDAVIGATVAARLGLKPGDSLLSSPETVFDIAGIYPLKMNVVGVFAPTGTSDDLAVFIDIKTSWIVEGLGHGHKDVTKTKDQSVLLTRTAGKVVANAKLVQFTEITSKNIGGFHFHGSPEKFPITAVIAVPNDTKSGTVLRGRYLNKNMTLQIVRPVTVIDGLLQNIFRVKNVLDAIIAIVGAATLLAIILVFALSLRLRQREIVTIFKLGCSRLTIARLLVAEILIIGLISALLSAIGLWVLDLYSSDLVRTLFIAA